MDELMEFIETHLRQSYDDTWKPENKQVFIDTAREMYENGFSKNQIKEIFIKIYSAVRDEYDVLK